MITDPIADYLTRIRNAVKANHRIVEIPASNLKKGITKILFEKGYILNYKFEDDKRWYYKNALKYHPSTKIPAINNIQRVSRPGLRNIAVMLSSQGSEWFGNCHNFYIQGLVTDKEARKDRCWRRSNLLRKLKGEKNVKNRKITH
jgi:small subunit ribosomal protein S8